jgi:tRNA(Ile)-lysidine synthase
LNPTRKLVLSRAPKLSGFARRLLSAWKQAGFPTGDAPIIVAVSGGADSTALLLGLNELIQRGKLSLKVTVAHLDHGLREQSKQDAAWVKRLANDLGYPVVVRRLDVRKLASKTDDNLEQAARRARYDFLKTTARKAQAQLILTAHTLDDQAETVLLRLLRGSAAEGLGGIAAVRTLERGSQLKLGRPLVSWARRAEVEDYCRAQQVEFRRDEMNENEEFSRVRVRKQLLPLMQSFNNKIVEALSRTATLLREDADVLSLEAEKLLSAATAGSELNLNGNSSLNVKVVASAAPAVRRRALRLWLERERGHLRRLEMVHLVAIERLLMGDTGGRVAQLPDGEVTRKRGWLVLNGVASRKKS